MSEREQDVTDWREAVLQYEFLLTYSEYAYQTNPVWAGDSSYPLAEVLMGYEFTGR